jgi:hypothetical protein
MKLQKVLFLMCCLFATHTSFCSNQRELKSFVDLDSLSEQCVRVVRTHCRMLEAYNLKKSLTKQQELLTKLLEVSKDFLNKLLKAHETQTTANTENDQDLHVCFSVPKKLITKLSEVAKDALTHVISIYKLGVQDISEILREYISHISQSLTQAEISALNSILANDTVRTLLEHAEEFAQVFKASLRK